MQTTLSMNHFSTPVPTVRTPLSKALLNGFTEQHPIETFQQHWRNHGDFVHLHIVNNHIYLASHPQFAQEALIDQRDNYKKMGYANQDVLRLVLGNGLLTNFDQDSWLSQRRMIQPVFHRKRIAQMTTTMAQCGDDMLNRWRKTYQSGDVVEVGHEMTNVTMDIITRTMFNTNVLDRANQMGEAITTTLSFVFARRLGIHPPLNWPTPRNLEYKKALKTLDSLMYQLIDDRSGHENEYDDLLSMLLLARDEETGKGMSREQVRDQLTTFFGAGHETTSNALTWTLHLLSQHPDVQKKLQEEIDSVLGGRTPTMEDLPKLSYTRMVFDESMRLYPPASITARYCVEECEINGKPQSADSVLILSIYNMHRHPEIWQEPLAFRPERFADPHPTSHRMGYLPFGGGQRMCIGNQFALTEGQLLLAQMVQAYNFLPVPQKPVEMELAVTLRPKNGLYLRLFPRHV